MIKEFLVAYKSSLVVVLGELLSILIIDLRYDKPLWVK